MKTKVKTNYILSFTLLLCIFTSIYNMREHKITDKSKLLQLKEKLSLDGLTKDENCELCILEMQLEGGYTKCDIQRFAKSLIDGNISKKNIYILAYANDISVLEVKILHLLNMMYFDDGMLQMRTSDYKILVYYLEGYYYLSKRHEFNYNLKDVLQCLHRNISDIPSFDEDMYIDKAYQWDIEDLDSEKAEYLLKILYGLPYNYEDIDIQAKELNSVISILKNKY